MSDLPAPAFSAEPQPPDPRTATDTKADQKVADQIKETHEWFQAEMAKVRAASEEAVAALHTRVTDLEAKLASEAAKIHKMYG